MKKFIVTFHTAFGSMVEAAAPILTVGPFNSYVEAESAAKVIWDVADRKDRTKTIYNDVWFNIVEIPNKTMSNKEAVNKLLELCDLGEDDGDVGVPIAGFPLGNVADLLKHLGLDDKRH